MKKIIYLLTILLLYNVAFSSAYTTISKTDADCECEGTITIRGDQIIVQIVQILIFINYY